MRKLWYIERMVIAVLLLLLLALAPAKAENVVYEGYVTTLSVEQMPGDTYVWELYNDPSVNFATDAGTAVVDGDAEFVGTNDGSTVNVKWKEPGTYFFKVTAYDDDKCAMNLKVGMITVKESDIKPTAVITPPNPNEICEGDRILLEIIFTGTGPWEFTYTDGTNSETLTAPESPYKLSVNPKESTEYWITGVKDVNGSNDSESAKVWLIVHPKPVPSRIYQVEE